MPDQLPTRRYATRIAGVGVLVLLIAGGVWYFTPRSGDVAIPNPGTPPPVPEPDPAVPDPREVFPSPFRNIKPGVAYTGDAACADCHMELSTTFHRHPMGRSSDWVDRAEPVERYDEAAKNPFTAAGFRFRVEQIGGRVVHRMSPAGAEPTRFPDYAPAVDVAIGSGTRGRTYLTIEAGSVWQSPVSWFTKDARWDLSPQHELENGGRRSINAACLFCHTAGVDPVPGAENRFREPLFPLQVHIGCERCHGPGALHVAQRRAGPPQAGTDYSIVNPRHLPSDLRLDVCRQCHLQGVDRVVRRGRDVSEYRPGLPWDQFVTVFVLRPDVADYRKSVGQFEQMESSRCFIGSGGKLGCVSCHDPHSKSSAEEAAAFYRRRCQSCHQPAGCSAPEPERSAAANNCIRCHMPRTDSSTIAHASITDHRVLRKPGGSAPAPRMEGPPLVPYRPGPHAPRAEERDRDWGIAAARIVASVPEGRGLARFAADRLSGSLARWRGDAEAWTSLAAVRGAAGDSRGAVEAARFAAALAPGSEASLARLALEARLAGDFDAALPTTDSLTRLNPRSTSFLLTRAEIHIHRRDYAAAETDARSALAIQPLHWKARLYLAVCRHHRGDPAGAGRDAIAALKLIPDDRLRPAYTAWFKEQTR